MASGGLAEVSGQETALFCGVLSAALFPQRYPMPYIRQEQYGELHDMLAGHTLAILPWDLLTEEEVTRPLWDQWEKETYAQKQRFGQYLLQQDGVLRLFRQAGIPCAILKGAVSAAYYPEPAYRAMGDIDLLVRPEDQERAAALLKAGGFRECGYRDEIEQGFCKATVLVELHTGLCPEGENAQAINEYLLSHFDALQTKQLYGFSFPCLPEICNGLVMLEHMHHHLRDTLGFRQVIDWMLYVDGYLNDEVWDRTMGSLFARFGLETFAVTITAMCQQYFGLREDIRWTKAADRELCRELFAHIDTMGNFGRKLEATPKSAAAMLRGISLTQALAILQKTGLDSWELCHRYPWLKPFAWLRRGVSVLNCSLAEKYNMSLPLVIQERRRVRKALGLMRRLNLPQDGR